jgi:Flp pilus assembly protein TadD
MTTTNPAEYGLSAEDTERRIYRLKLLIYVCLAACTLAAYEPVRHNDFVRYDDHVHIIENTNLNGGITRQSVICAFTKVYLANWYPVTWLSHMLDFEIYGPNPAGHHITSLLIHTAGSLLLFWTLLKMTRAMWASAFVAAVFAIHPVHVESVAWASERKDVLSGLFWILTMLAYAHYAERPNFKRYTLVLLAFVMGLMSKPMVVTLPFVLLLLDYWPLERFKRQKATAGWLIIEKVPLFALSAVSSVITFMAQKSGGAINTLETVPLDYRIANMFISYMRYIHKTIWPSKLAVMYPLSEAIPSKEALLFCALLFVLITTLSIYIGRRKKYVAVGWLWYVGTLVPVIGLVQVGSQAMADRYMYIPMLGLLIIVAWGVKDLISNRPRWRTITAVSAGVVLFSAIILTRMQVSYWQNTLTLFEHALKVTGKNRIAEGAYGHALIEAGKPDEGLLHLRNAVRISPTSFNTRNDLGKALLKQGKYSEAVACFNELINHKEVTAGVYENLGTAYTQLGRYEPAIQNWNKAIQLDPNNTNILNNLAWLLATSENISLRNADKAIELARRACELTGYKEAYQLDTLAAAYAASGRFDEAVTTAQQAVNAAKGSGKEEMVSEIQNRLELYQRGQAYVGK